MNKRDVLKAYRTGNKIFFEYNKSSVCVGRANNDWSKVFWAAYDGHLRWARKRTFEYPLFTAAREAKTRGLVPNVGKVSLNYKVGA